jgi:hypothetical protein
MADSKDVSRLLGVSGLTPFALLALAGWVSLPTWINTLLIGYALAILSFLAGSLWMGALRSDAARHEPLVASKVLVLAALPALLLPLAWASGLLAALFAIHLLVEQRWIRRDLEGWYRRLRFLLSGVAIALMSLAFLGGLAGGGEQPS